MASARLKNWSILAAATLSICVFVGCDKLESESSHAERQVDETARQALQEEEAQQPGLYNTVAQDVTGKSDVATARARQLQAQAEYNAGTAMMRQASNEASELAMRMIDIDHLISTIQTGNALVAGYGKYDSTQIKQEASDQIAKIQGSANQSAWVDGDHPIPTLSAVKQTISQLQGEIRQKQDEVESLTKQRVADLRRAEDLSEKADKSTGQAWVDLYRQASGLRKKASNLSTQIDNVSASIEPLKVQLAIAQAQQQIAEAAITGIRKQADGAEQNFAEVRQGAHGQDAVQKQVYENAAGAQKEGTTSLHSQLEALVTEAAKVQNTWDAAEKLLSDSAEHFAAAQSAAESLQVKLDQRAVEIQGDIPEKAAWEQLKHVYSATSFQYARGVSLQALGMLCADQIASLKRLSDLKTRATAVLSEAKLTVPPSLASADYDSTISHASDTGKKSFTQADDLFQNAANAPLASASQQNGARVARILELYGWYQLGLLTGDADAAAHLSAAHDAIKDATDHSAVMPMLPAEIEPRLAVPAAALTAPATGGAAPAAAGGTPADDATVAAIKQSAQDAVAAVQSGDANKIKQFVVVPPEMAGSMDSMIALMTSSMHLEKSAKAKFGNKANALMGGAGGMNMNMPSAKQIDAMMGQAQFTMTSPDSISMTVAGQPQPIPLKKNGNEWAIDLATALKAQPQAAAMLPMMSKMFQPMADGMNQIANDIDAGKYQNVQEVKVAMQKMMAPIIAQMMMQNAGGGGANVAGTPANPPAAH